MQKSRYDIVLVKLVPGGKGEGVDTAEFAVRSILDNLLDGTDRFRLRRLSESTEKILSYGRMFHGLTD